VCSGRAGPPCTSPWSAGSLPRTSSAMSKDHRSGAPRRVRCMLCPGDSLVWRDVTRPIPPTALQEPANDNRDSVVRALSSKVPHRSTVGNVLSMGAGMLSRWARATGSVPLMLMLSDHHQTRQRMATKFCIKPASILGLKTSARPAAAAAVRRLPGRQTGAGPPRH